MKQVYYFGGSTIRVTEPEVHDYLDVISSKLREFPKSLSPLEISVIFNKISTNLVLALISSGMIQYSNTSSQKPS